MSWSTGSTRTGTSRSSQRSAAHDLDAVRGLHDRARDIPAQARALHDSNRLRLIADVHYEPAPLVPNVNPLTATPLDLSGAVLRSVSPIHLEYLTDMGVTASMSVSLLNEAVPWGLIACHHHSGPHRPPQRVRAAAEFLGQVMSWLIAAKQRADDYQRTIRAQALQADLAELVAADTGPLAQRVAAHADLLLRMVGATGAGVQIGDEAATAGITPPPDRLEALAQWLWRSGESVAATSALGGDNEDFADLAEIASGVLGVSVVQQGLGHVLWFRPAVADGGAAEPWTALDREVAADAGRHIAGLVLDEAAEALDIARTLQRSLAPEVLPSVAGFEIDSRYSISGEGDVGGDWYDVLDLPGDGVAVVVGDVAGHGVPAATTMAQVRHAVRAYLLDCADPATTLSKTARLVDALAPGEVASCLIALFEPDSDDVRLATAGHPPPLLIGDGWADYVEVPSGPALGLLGDASYTEVVQRLGDATLLLYTDGLIERRGEAIDVGLQRLASACAAHVGTADFLDRLIAEVPAQPTNDDMAIIAVRRGDTSA